MDFIQAVHTLVGAGIPFTTHYVSPKNPVNVVITVTDSLNAEQVRTMGTLGASMEKNGIFRMLTSYDDGT